MRLIDAEALKEELSRTLLCEEPDRRYRQIIGIIDNVPTVEPEELKRVRNICEHWNDKSSSFVSACNAFEDILHIFKMGVGDIKGGAE